MKALDHFVKIAFFGNRTKDQQTAHNAYTDEMNKPKKIKRLNEIHAEILKRAGYTQNNAPEHVWQQAYYEALGHPYFQKIINKHLV